MLINPANRTSLGLATTDSPVFANVKLSGLNDGYIPYHVSDAAGLGDSKIFQNATGIGIGVAPLDALQVEGVSGEYRTGIKISCDSTTYGPTLIGYTTRDASNRLYWSGSLIASNDQSLIWGSGSFASQGFSTTGNDFLSLSMKCGNSSYSGNFVIKSSTTSPTSNYPLVSNPTLRLQAESSTIAHYIQFYHNQTNGCIDVGTGRLVLTGKGLTLPSGSATALTAPLLFTSGTLLTNAEAGAIEYLTNQFYMRLDGLTVLSDSKGLIVGAGSDASFIYNGTAGVINTSLVAASDLNITCGTDKTVVLTETVWDDLRITPGSFDRPGSNDPTTVLYYPNGGGIGVLLYEFQVDDYACFTIQLPHAYKEGTDIYAHIHWTPGDRGNEENGKTVGWKIDYAWANINGTFGSMQTLDLSDTCDGTDHKHLMTPDIVIDGHTAAKTVSSMLVCNVRRSDTGTDDTWVGTASGQLPMILEIDFHYEIDTMGSRQVFAK